MKRIALLKNQLSNNNIDTKSTPSKNTQTQPQIQKPIKYKASAYDYLDFDQFLNKDERKYRLSLREFLKTEIESQINSFIEKKEFPRILIQKILAKFPGIMGFSLKGYGSAGYSLWLTWAVLMELSRCDLSLATFFLVNGGELIMKAIYQLGSEDQRKKYLPPMNTLESIGSFCLTEPDYGSDASNLSTYVKEEGEFYILNGKKRWIGNGSIAQVYVVFARNVANKKVQGFILESNTPGIEVTEIQGKLSTRGVINCEISFKDVKIPKINKLEKANDFHSGTAKMLFGSRIDVAWLCAGACIGAYDRVINYCSNRIQFGKYLTSFQLVQEKIAKIMANTQAVIAFCKRISDLYIQGELSIGQVGSLKAWCTYTTRDTLAIARELLGGNGILIDNWVMKTMLDVESLHTYEGTADINYLVSAKELTGISAFK
jgi:alkylation response protein AidB-like acyl-CoA dehydrogenase